MSKVEKNVQNAFTNLVTAVVDGTEVETDDIIVVGVALGYTLDELRNNDLLPENDDEDEDDNKEE
jgi:hypothetical protein